MNCPNCGVKLANISKFCPECGSKLTVQEEKKNNKAPDSIEELLVNIVQNYGGPELYKKENSNKLSGLLKDFAGYNFQDEIKLLSRVVPEGIQEVLYKSNNSSPEEKQGALVACKMKMIEDLFLNEAKAADATNILAAGLGWSASDNKKTNSSPVTKSQKTANRTVVSKVDVSKCNDYDYLKTLSLEEILDLEKKTQNADVQNCIGLFYYDSSIKKAPVDYKQAFKWFQMAANNGCAAAMRNIAFMYDYGQGQKRDSERAFEWYQKAADLGDARAQFALGNMYNGGDDVVEYCPEKAVEWYQKAADQGYGMASFFLKLLRDAGD